MSPWRPPNRYQKGEALERYVSTSGVSNQESSGGLGLLLVSRVTNWEDKGVRA